MNNILPVPGTNVLPALDEFKVVTVPVLLLGYLAAHGHDDALPSWHGNDLIEVTQYAIAPYSGKPLVYRIAIEATMTAVRTFLGYPA